MMGLLQDVQYAFRGFARAPGFLAVAVFSFAIGIAFNTSMFALVDGILLRPPRVERPDRLVNIYTSQYDEPYQTSSYPDYVDLRNRTSVLAGILAFSPSIAALRIGDRSRLALGEVVTGNYFSVLGLRPAAGRLLSPVDDRVGASRVVVISHRMWSREFASDPLVIGRDVRIHGQPYVIVGVAPESYTGVFPLVQPEIWTPMAWASDVESAGISNTVPSPGNTCLEQRGCRWLFVQGRLRDDQTVARASAEVSTIGAQLSKEHPDSNVNRRVSVVASTQARVLPQADRALRALAVVLMLGVGLVLVVACANVSSLLLARSVTRQREFGIRLALGCGRLRLVRQLAVESLLLSAAGAAAGIALAWTMLRSVAAIRLPLPIPLVLDMRLDARILAFGIAAAVIAGLTAVTLPARRVSLFAPMIHLKDEMAILTTTAGRWSMREVLIVGQIAITFLLLVVAGLHLRSLAAASEVPLGFRADGVAAVAFDAHMIGYGQARRNDLYQRAIDRVRALPGVTSAAFTRRVPLSLTFTENTILVEGHDRSGEDGMAVSTTSVSAEYFETLGIRLIGGRNFSSADTEQSQRVAIINETMARLYWPNQSPIGKRFHVRAWNTPPIEVVGVSADYKIRFVTEPSTPYIHYPWSQRPGAPVIAARTSGEAEVLAAAMQQEIRRLEPEVVFIETPTLEKQVSISVLPLTLLSSTAAVVSAVSMVLAGIGLYGLLAYVVARRTREIGIRTALGGDTSRIVAMVTRRGMRLIGFGLLLGTPLAIVAARLLSHVVFGVQPGDVVTWVGSVGVVLIGSVLAHVVPARRAARVDPLVALRYE